MTHHINSVLGVFFLKKSYKIVRVISLYLYVKLQ